MLTLPRAPQMIRRTVLNIPYFAKSNVAENAETFSDQDIVVCCWLPLTPAISDDVCTAQTLVCGESRRSKDD